MDQGIKKNTFFRYILCLSLFSPIFFLSLTGGKLALITEARAAERLTLGVVDVTQKEIPPASWPELYQILLNELSKEKGFSVLKPEEIAYVLDARPLYSETAYQLETAGKLLMEARDLYKNSKFDKAVEKLKTAKSTFLYKLESAEDLSVLSDIYRYLAMS
ncbi:MAG: hypothetical protein JSU92_00545, partial [Deltaproteobacteria bacterium]